MKQWLKWLLLGILSVAIGAFVLGNAVAASLAVATLTGVMFLISGGFQIFAGLSAKGTASKIFTVALGGLMVLVGASFLLSPRDGVISLSLLVIVLLLASGTVRIVFSRRMRGTDYARWMLISGIVSIGLAIVVLVNFSTASDKLIGILLGIELIFNGAGLVVLAFFMRTNPEKSVAR